MTDNLKARLEEAGLLYKHKQMMLQELLDLEEGLTDWEVEFLEDVYRQWENTENLSRKQSEKLEEIYNDRT